MKRDDDVLEEDYVLLSEWDGKAGDDGSQNVKKLCSTVELVIFVDQRVETLVDGLPDHLSPRH